MEKIFSILIITGILISGCASKGTVKETNLDEQQKSVQQHDNRETDTGASKEGITSKEANTSSDLNSLRLIKEMEARMRDVHFDFDMYAIKNDEKPLLREVADMLLKNGRLKVTIEGNCDDRGTNEYNLALGDRRAKAAKDFLLSLGVPAVRMDTVSYGEEKPVCTGDNEACWAKNRRDHFVLN